MEELQSTYGIQQRRRDPTHERAAQDNANEHLKLNVCGSAAPCRHLYLQEPPAVAIARLSSMLYDETCTCIDLA
jgi:hypothetical protein